MKKTKILESWEKNAGEWVKIIDQDEIISRRYTNKAIEDILRTMPENKIVDIGCGEGWLTRRMTQIGKTAVGIDAIEALLVDARTKGPELFFRISYEEIMGGETIPGSPYDAAVFNFCLYQKEGLSKLLESTRKNLEKNGKIIIQTLHPHFLVSNGLEYKSQMIADSWSGLPGNFSEGHPWYARTFEDWISVITKARMKVIELREIIDSNKKPISLILKLT